MKYLRIFRVLLLVLMLVGCNENSNDPRPAGSSGAGVRNPTMVSGRAVDAEIVGGTVSVFSFGGGEKGEFLGSAVTDGFGNYALEIIAESQYVLLELQGGFYTEEASGVPVNLKEGQVLRAITFYEFGKPLDIMVTPFTNVAAGLISYKLKENSSLPNAVARANTAVSSMVGVDIIAVSPENITNIANVSTSLTEELKYGFMGAAISSWTKTASERNGTDPHSIWTSISFAQVMYRDILADGFLDGKGLSADGSEVVDLAFGLVQLDSHTYRAEFAQHLMGMVAGNLNQVGITLVQALPEADRLNNLTALFADIPPIPFDDEGPEITPGEAEGLYHNAAFDFKVLLSDVVGVKSVVFDLNGQVLGVAPPETAIFPINTKLYSDGEYLIGVRAVDNLGNESYKTFRVNFLNGGSGINLLSSTWFNSSPVSLFGNYIDNGTGVQSILVEGVAATLDLGKGTWEVEIPLEDVASPAAFSKQVAFVTTDGLGVVNSELITIMMDKLPPVFEPVPLYSNATFISEGATFTAKLSFAESSGIPIRIETDHLSLDGTTLLEGPLSTANIPWIRLRVEDTEINEVFSQKEEITAEIQYSLEENILTPWRMLLPVITGNNDYRFIVPLVSEYLHEDWDMATPLEGHLIEVKIKDKAGNTSVYEFRFKVEFVPPAPSMVLKSINPFSVDFAKRGSLYNALLPVSQATITNTSSEAMLFSVGGDSSHAVTLRYEEALRIHHAVEVKGEEWRAKFRYAITNPQITTWPLHVDLGEATLWKMISQIYYGSIGSNGLQVATRPEEVRGAAFALASDQLPFPTLDPWASFNPPNADLSSRNYYGDGPCCYYIRYFAYKAEGGHYLHHRSFSRFESVEGHPFTQLDNREISAGFSVDAFEVLNQFGLPAISINGWFRLPPHETFQVTKSVNTPEMPSFNDTEVGNPTQFSSYTLKQYDKGIDWAIDETIEVRAVHDVEISRAPEMFALAVKRGISEINYSLSR